MNFNVIARSEATKQSMNYELAERMETDSPQGEKYE